MIDFKLIDSEPFSLKKNEKNLFFKSYLIPLLTHHKKNSKYFEKILSKMKFNINEDILIEDMPFIPVRLFKNIDLKSVVDNEVYKVLRSSGTGGDSSKIFLNKKNTKDQVDILSKISSSFLGKKRLPMLIIDSKTTTKNKNSYSARAAGINGFSIFGKTPTYALNEDMSINFEALNKFIENYGNKKFLIYGFTSIIWESFINIGKQNEYNMSNGILLHGGGWKKLANKNITNIDFKKKILESFGIKTVINYYGMVEQTGSIFFECKEGYFHTSIYSEILIRDKNFNLLKSNMSGIIQLMSLVPTSYPGNSIITEDIGEIIGEDNCKCGRMGKYFLVHGRIDNAELRGCSDAY